MNFIECSWQNLLTFLRYSKSLPQNITFVFSIHKAYVMHYKPVIYHNDNMILLQHLQRQFPLQSFHLKCICALKRKSGSRNERYRNKTHMNVRIQFPQLFKTAFCAWNFSDIVFCQIELRMVIFFSQLNTIVSKYTCDERSCAATVLLSYMVTLLGPARITFFAIGELLKIHKTLY